MEAPSSIDVRPARALALGVHGVAALLFVSGGLAAAVDIAAAAGHDEWFHHRVKPLALMVHGGAAMALLLLIGALIPTHVVPAWRSGRNRLIGSVVVVVLATLIVTGYGLYYLGDEQWRTVTMWTHLGVGIIEPILFIIHIIAGRRSRITRHIT